MKAPIETSLLPEMKATKVVSENISKILCVLNRKTLYCEFKMFCTSACNTVLFQAEYFSFEIKIFVITTMGGTIEYIIHIDQWLNKNSQDNQTQLLEENLRYIFSSLDDAIASLNKFIQQHPLTIVKHGHGEYQVLDPDGFDLIGEYVVKSDAIKTTRNNYKMRS